LLVSCSLMAAVLSGCGGGGEPSKCGKTCATDRTKGNSKTGFTDNTGFVAGSQTECCDICAVKDVTGAAGGDGQYNWDYVIMDHLFVPQFCHALSEGHDFTLTNTEGSKCTHAGSELAKIQIHGLWVDWYKSFSTCCGSAPATLDPAAVQSWDIFNDLKRNWTDGAVSSGCSVCYNLNHEWQKHGTCFTDKPESYFDVGLALQRSTATPMYGILSVLSANAGKTVAADDVLNAWKVNFDGAGQKPPRINLICDPHSATAVNGTQINYLSEIQVCWKRKDSAPKGVPVHSPGDLELMDCPAAAKRGFTEPCGTTLAVYGPAAGNVLKIASP